MYLRVDSGKRGVTVSGKANTGAVLREMQRLFPGKAQCLGQTPEQQCSLF